MESGEPACVIETACFLRYCLLRRVEVDPGVAAICGKNQCGAVGYGASGDRDRIRRTSLGGEVGVDFTNPLAYTMRLAAARVQVS
jgi:hypothetical protein